MSTARDESRPAGMSSIGAVEDATGNSDAGLSIIAAAMVVASGVALLSRRFTSPGRLAEQVGDTTATTGRLD